LFGLFSGGFSPAQGETMHHNPDHRALLADAHRALKERITHRAPETSHPADNPRRQRSLRSCHYPKSDEQPLIQFRDTGAYVPELSARIEDDPNLTDGARRCARKIAQYAYRHHRENRAAKITVGYLAHALRKCRRTVQGYLRQLERAGYVRVGVVSSGRTRMCVGLLIELLAPLFPRHRQEKWPGNAMNSGVQKSSHNKRFLDSLYKGKPVIPREAWALRCMDGVFRALIATLPQLPPIVSCEMG
jgi:hypothetical protein